MNPGSGTTPTPSDPYCIGPLTTVTQQFHRELQSREPSARNPTAVSLESTPAHSEARKPRIAAGIENPTARGGHDPEEGEGRPRAVSVSISWWFGVTVYTVSVCS